MNFQLDIIKDKVEFFEAFSIQELEKKINDQILHNQAILLTVHSVTHQMYISEEGKRLYSAVVHFKASSQ
ncbi:DUF2536 family protein [Metabacillus litoralis]|uniref:DUF2536 family protein n=1 Tax=Metabacillus litoralis TaxID=152268 RepID=A0A5C6W2I6_9BACI|nr:MULTISPECIES: DUF2536 family protein [Metabacillus]MBM7605820.1 hypothetical protein [Metabacillus crassostreae]TXC90030.1 DUF2536 family protein [Metabacillus litoralis]